MFQSSTLGRYLFLSFLARVIYSNSYSICLSPKCLKIALNICDIDLSQSNILQRESGVPDVPKQLFRTVISI